MISSSVMLDLAPYSTGRISCGKPESQPAMVRVRLRLIVLTVVRSQPDSATIYLPGSKYIASSRPYPAQKSRKRRAISCPMAG